MEANELITHPSSQREFQMFRRLGGRIEIYKNKVILFPVVIPSEIAEAFAQRIRSLDTENLLEVSVKSEA